MALGGLLGFEVTLAVVNPLRLLVLLSVEAGLLGEEIRPILATLTPPLVVIAGFFKLLSFELLGDKLVAEEYLFLAETGALGEV